MTSDDTITAPAGAWQDAAPADGRALLAQQLDALGRRAAGRVSALRGIPGIGTWFGLVLTIAGILVLALGWSRVADIGVVALQMPYVISAGGAGLSLVVVGLAAVVIAAKVTEASARRDQLRELQETMAAIRERLEAQR